MKTRIGQFVALGLLLVGPFALDRILKWYFQAFPVERGMLLFSMPIGVTLHKNAGIVSNIPVPLWLIVGFSVVFIAVLVFFLKKELARMVGTLNWQAVGLALVISGALSNLLDRLAFGYVIDYFQVFTGIFNVADMAIVVGVLVIFLKRSENLA